MRSFRLHNPVQLVFGAGSAKRVGRLMQVQGMSRVLLVTGMASAEQSGALGRVFASLEKHGVEIVRRVRLAPGPCVEDLRPHAAGLGAIHAVLGVGGGSVMDAAKILAAAPYLEDIWEPVAAGRHILKALPVFTVSTLPGSGSEVNDHALIASREHGIKTAAKGPALFPCASVVDPAMQVAPLELTAAAAMDAMAHVLEHYVMCRGQEAPLAVGEALMRTLLEGMRGLRQSPDALDLRADLAWAGILAQNGTMAAGSGGGEWTVHLLAHCLEARALAGAPGPAVHHAALVAALFPAWIETVHQEAPDLFERWARVVWGLDSPLAATSAWREEMLGWGLEPWLKGQGIDASLLRAVRQDFMAEPLGRAFRLGPLRLDELLARAWSGLADDSPY